MMVKKLYTNLHGTQNQQYRTFADKVYTVKTDTFSKVLVN